MKINIELDITPQEAKELFTAMPSSLHPFQLMLFDKFKQQWLEEGKPVGDFWQQLSETGGQSMMDYWNTVSQSFFNSETSKDSKSSK